MSAQHATAELVAPALLHEHVGRQLGELAELLGLGSARPLLARTHDLLCGESAAYPITQASPRRSALNADGTPLQLSLTFGVAEPRLQLLSDVGAPQLSGARRMADARGCARELAELFGAGRALAAVEPLVETIAPAGDPALLAEPAGAFWIGAGFARGRAATLKLYVNARWGEPQSRWARLDELAAGLGAADRWHGIRARLQDATGERSCEGLAPLGAALAVTASGPPAGRIYLAGFGRAWPPLETLATSCGGDAFAARLRRCARALLADDYGYPTRSVVCSFGLREGRLVDTKVELCAHCAFDSDVQAQERCQGWLRDDPTAAAIYRRTVALLSGGRLSATETTLHSYLGVGSRDERTLYFNPGAARAADDCSSGEGASGDGP